ncbi:hypothetical protein GCM10010472_55590 [Pseudonocardia halophobica]|uniref:DUF998 domain-containing protein n=1 Tax=Pseudonocardia halophobica TaxID=29401 RepID=A0A9W6NVS6_9PSEU|nr:hypothetical protein [Pseudonocardia halophobica]GLL11635.1 hypothetical protein GCM10017577_27760 [Pseudonocardia halophobica]
MDPIRAARAGAVLCVVGALGAVLFSAALLAGFAPADESPYLLPIYVATLAGVVALALTGAAAGGTGRVGVALAIVGLLGFIAAEAASPGPTGDALYAVVPLLTALGMLLAGAAVLRSGRWSGWHRVVPLLVGAWIVVVAVPVIILTGGPGPGAPAAVTALGVWHLLWAALGAAVLAETRTGERVPA